MADMLNLKKVGGAARSLVGRMAIRAPDGANKTLFYLFLLTHTANISLFTLKSLKRVCFLKEKNIFYVL